MEQLKVAGAAGSNAVLALVQTVASASPLDTALIVCQILVAAVTVLYIGSKVWDRWKKKD
jgi:hypothetical protein